MKRKANAPRLREAIVAAILLVIALFYLLPIVWMIAASFQGEGEIFKIPFNWLPIKEGTLNSYRFALTNGQMLPAFLNSIKAAAALVLIQVSLSTITGYVMCKYNFRFKNAAFIFIMMTLMVPPELTYFPLFDIVKHLHITNSTLGLIFPFIYSGFGIIYMRQFSTYIPNEILEAARIDGCGHIRTFFSVALPMLKGAVSGLMILAFTFIWSEFAWARSIITQDNAKTLALSLTQLAAGTDNYINYAALTAGGVLVMAPVLIIYLIFQKNFIESVAKSGLKG